MVRRLGRQWRLRGWRLRGLGGSSGSLTSLEVLEIFPSFNVHGLKVTSVNRRVGTGLQVHLVELASREVVLNFTSLDIVPSVTGERGSKCGGTEESDSKESDFGSVLHDVLVIRGLENSCRIGE
jgi:hypothetical protein